MIRTKVKASAIQYALVLTVVMALLLGGLILFAGANRSIQTQFQIQSNLQANALSGINYGKGFIKTLPLNTPQQVVLFEGGVDSVRLTKKHWGAYTILVSEAHHGKQSVRKLAMIGQGAAEQKQCLYLADLGNPLSLCGETKIEGDCALPKRGAKRAYIAGQNYIGNKLIYGETQTAESQLPAMDRDVLSQIDAPLLVEKSDWTPIDTLKNSFLNSPQHFYSIGPIAIENTIKGQVLIESADSIFVGRDAQLEHVILKSPIVHLEQGFTGQVQIFASHKIRMEEGVVLTYPSVLGLIENQTHEVQSTIDVHEGAIVLGSVFLTSEQPNFRREVQLNIAPDAHIAGLVYCNGKTQVKGSVNGRLLTKKFYLKTASSAYENHLLNAEIRHDLPDDFAVIPLLDNIDKYQTLTWLK